MYTHITTKCNMTCAHCCYAANSKGEHMDFDMFKTILKKWSGVINTGNNYIVLGGGEPTMHPDFWKFLEYAQRCGYPWLATNGSNAETSLKLCEMAKTGELSCALSIDEWHDPIEPEVVKAFKEGMVPSNHGRYKLWVPKEGCGCDKREIRTVIIPFKGGRASKLPESLDYCPCPGVQFRPNGDVYPCGCDEAPVIGTVDSGINGVQYAYFDVFRGCYKKRNPLTKEKT